MFRLFGFYCYGRLITKLLIDFRYDQFKNPVGHIPSVFFIKRRRCPLDGSQPVADRNRRLRELGRTNPGWMIWNFDVVYWSRLYISAGMRTNNTYPFNSRYNFFRGRQNDHRMVAIFSIAALNVHPDNLTLIGNRHDNCPSACQSSSVADSAGGSHDAAQSLS